MGADFTSSPVPVDRNETPRVDGSLRGCAARERTGASRARSPQDDGRSCRRAVPDVDAANSHRPPVQATSGRVVIVPSEGAVDYWPVEGDTVDLSRRPARQTLLHRHRGRSPFPMSTALPATSFAVRFRSRNVDSDVTVTGGHATDITGYRPELPSS